jgi:hypothetical protein
VKCLTFSLDDAWKGLERYGSEQQQLNKAPRRLVVLGLRKTVRV